MYFLTNDLSPEFIRLSSDESATIQKPTVYHIKSAKQNPTGVGIPTRKTRTLSFSLTHLLMFSINLNCPPDVLILGTEPGANLLIS